jgi:hypothetical protein
VIITSAITTTSMCWACGRDFAQGRYIASALVAPPADIKLELRPYQRDGFAAIEVALQRRVLVWPTGAGKTVPFAHTLAQREDVAYFACRGYTSLSEAWSLAHHELLHAIGIGQRPVMLHLGDHDPSGLDMTRDVSNRLALFCYRKIEIKRLALNFDQVEQYNPPPNPAKTEDSRYATHASELGDESWELDALDPTVLADLVGDAIDELRDPDRWAVAVAEERSARTQLGVLAERLPEVEAFLAPDGDAG